MCERFSSILIISYSSGHSVLSINSVLQVKHILKYAITTPFLREKLSLHVVVCWLQDLFWHTLQVYLHLDHLLSRILYHLIHINHLRMKDQKLIQNSTGMFCIFNPIIFIEGFFE